jgi:predicted GNAT family acetyltransferase
MEITNNKMEFRFELQLPDGEIAKIEYRWLKGSMVLMHTFVPLPGRGKGVASKLIKYVLEYAREHHLKIIVYCPFVTKYMETNPEYNDLLDQEHPNTKRS